MPDVLSWLVGSVTFGTSAKPAATTKILQTPKMHRTAILYEASQAVLSTFELDEVLRQILAIARDHFHLQNVAILLMEEDKQELVVKSQIGYGNEVGFVRLPVGTGLIGTAALQKRTIYAPDVSKNPNYMACCPLTRSEIAVPLI